MKAAAKAKKGYPRSSKRLTRVPLASLGGVIQEMAKVYRLARSSKMGHDNARSLVWMLDKLRSALEAQALERLEAKMDELAKTAEAGSHGHSPADQEYRLPH